MYQCTVHWLYNMQRDLSLLHVYSFKKPTTCTVATPLYQLSMTMETWVLKSDPWYYCIQYMYHRKQFKSMKHKAHLGNIGGGPSVTENGGLGAKVDTFSGKWQKRRMAERGSLVVSNWTREWREIWVTLLWFMFFILFVSFIIRTSDVNLGIYTHN